MVYCVGSPMDEISHKKYHRDKVSPMPYKRRKNDNIIFKRSDEEYIVLVESGDFSKRSFIQIFEYIDKQLGFNARKESKNEKAYLYISKKKVVGCIIVERIEKAHRLIKTEDDCIVIEENSESALVGISRLWVHPNFRKKFIASTLLDTMRYASLIDLSSN